MKYTEIVPPPAEVDIEFYDPQTGHISVAPLGFTHHEDESIVGTAYTGLAKELTHVHVGDAVITYPDGTVFIKKPGDARAFFAPKVKTKPKSAKPEPAALPEKFEEADIDELLAGTPE